MPESLLPFPGREQEDFKNPCPCGSPTTLWSRSSKASISLESGSKKKNSPPCLRRAGLRCGKRCIFADQRTGGAPAPPGAVVRSYAEKEVRDLYEVRLALENLAMDRIAERWQEEWEAEFHPILERMVQAAEAGDAKTYARHNADFHWLLMRLAGSDILWNLYRQTTYPLNTLTRLSTRTQEDLFRSTGEHRAIVEAMREHNFREAKALLSQNVQHGLERVLRVRF